MNWKPKMSKLMELTWLPTNNNVSVEVIKEQDKICVKLAVYESFDGYATDLTKEQIDELIILLTQAKECFNE